MFSASVFPCIQRGKTRQAKGKTKMMNIVILQSLTDWEELVSCAYSASGSLLSPSDGESLTACSPVQETHSEWELRPGSRPNSQDSGRLSEVGRSDPPWQKISTFIYLKFMCVCI